MNCDRIDSLVCYYRVSTRKQERSGLGLEGQQAAVQEFSRHHGANVLAKYTEVETGKRADRPELVRAIAHAKRARATLVVAKLDRLARNVAFTSPLMDSGVDFVCCDNPHANRLTIHILAAVAEDEARRISERTKAALAAYKARGGKLGASRPECRNLTDEARAKGSAIAWEVVRQNADRAYADLRELQTGLRNGGFEYQDIATVLNRQGHRTRTGKLWTNDTVRRVCLRFDETGKGR
jgi:DNA invertase Pin-like site-specific DNA recombinase